MAERTIQTLKTVMRKQLTARPDSTWSDHLPSALMLLRYSQQTTLKVPPFTIVTGRTPVPPCYFADPPPTLGAELDDSAYLEWLNHRITLASKPPVRTTPAPEEPELAPPADTLFHFSPG